MKWVQIEAQENKNDKGSYQSSVWQFVADYL